MPSLSEGTIGVLGQILNIVAGFWWVILPIVLGAILWRMWLNYIRGRYASEIEWVLLRLAIPQEIIKTPLAMEQVFATLHSIQSGGSRWDRYVKGKIQEWFSFEIRSAGGQIFFYVYTPQKYRDLVESSIYAQYPDAEIAEVEDYVWSLPGDILEGGYDISGTEFILAKEDAYPIRTYEEFTFEIEEGKRPSNIDPMAGLLEALSKIGEGEQFWLQIGIRPVGDAWKKEGEKLIAELMGEKKDTKKKSVLIEVLSKEAKDYIRGIPEAPIRPPEFGAETNREEKKESPRKELTPGGRKVIEAIERNISKVGFSTTIRGVYIAPQEVFNPGAFGAVTGNFRQYSTQNMNSFKPNSKTSTKGKWPFKNMRARWRKRKLIHKYRGRSKPEKSFVFNTEELATVFHFPSRTITTPALSRLDTKKGEPPAGLPSYP